MKPEELAVRLRNMVGRLHPNDAEVVIAAAVQCERAALEAGECRVLLVEGYRVAFPRQTRLCASIADLDAPLNPECIVVDGLQPGEHRAVDLWGQIVIVQRAPLTPREERAVA
jgi:hypothetical protein